MHHARPLPDYLVARYRHWRADMDAAGLRRRADLAQRGQSPRAMVIACCDSRVTATEVFAGRTGEFFVHRNIAALVPRHQPDTTQRGTSATIEYAVVTLGVEHLIVMGHRGCGGVAAYGAMIAGHAEAPAPDSFVAHWLSILDAGRVRSHAQDPGAGDDPGALERAAVLVSLENLMSFPFVRTAVEAERLHLHALWKDIAEGLLEFYDPARDAFVPV
jgi:carbonic anhydrase